MRPFIVAGLAGIEDVGGLLMEAPYGVADGPEIWSAFFRLNGAVVAGGAGADGPGRRVVQLS